MERSAHMVDVGPHGIIPANWPPFPQHALLAVVNPAEQQKHSHTIVLIQHKIGVRFGI